MRSDDAVETFKSHAYNEHGTTHSRRPQYSHCYATVPVLARFHVYLMSHIKVSGES